MKLIALGDNVIDYYHNTQECFPGGNAVNVAVHAARLGAQAEYLGSLGDDKMAHIVEKALRENGVDISHCPVLPGRTTKVCSYDVVNGERSFIEVITGESWTGPLQITAQELDELKTADLIVSSCNAKMPEQMAAVQALPAVFAYDFGEKEKYRTDAYYDEIWRCFPASRWTRLLLRNCARRCIAGAWCMFWPQWAQPGKCCLYKGKSWKRLPKW